MSGGSDLPTQQAAIGKGDLSTTAEAASRAHLDGGREASRRRPAAAVGDSRAAYAPLVCAIPVTNEPYR